MSLRLAAVALAVPIALIAGTLGTGPAGAVPAKARADTTAAADRVPPPSVPHLTWAPCDDGFECATATVPLDYARPHGSTISIALLRLPAADPAHRIGSLFVNPGGPGGSGTQTVRHEARTDFTDQVRARFDIVGFDPRFVGASRPLATCASDEEYLALFADLPAFPITPAEERAVHRANARYNQLCAERSPFLAHGATANVARDLDLLRQAVGEREMNYVGASYGSVLGQTYAALFPGRIRTLTIDGVLDAQEWSTGSAGESHRVPFTVRIGSAPGASATFQQFTQRCEQAGPQRCAFAADGDAAAKFERLAQRLKTDPYPMPDEPPFTYSVLVRTTLSVLYRPLVWAQYAQGLQTIYTDVFADGQRTTADTTADDLLAPARSGSSTPWTDEPTAEATPVDFQQALVSSVTCSDTVNPHTLTAWASAGARADRRSPYFGRAWTWVGESCASWLLPGVGRYLGPYDRATSSPVLVIGNTYDPSTPYTGAQAAARRIPGARLLTVNGYGHTTSAAPSACATAVFDTYVLTGHAPPRNTVCTQDIAPFTP